jgi:CBS domain-containing protein
MDLDEFLQDAAGRERPNLVEISIRDLIGRWGYQRRGYWVANGIDSDLERAGLVTEPDFKQGWIDADVTLVPRRLVPPQDKSAENGSASSDAVELVVTTGEVGLIVGSLRSASQPVCSVPPDATLLQAQTLMMKNDFSQLAVLSSSRDLRGAITWESIAQANMRKPQPEVKDCITEADVVRFEDDLVQRIPQIVRAGYVFVQKTDRTISGIVTTADLSEEFGKRSTPFFLVGEVERRLRRAVDRAFSASELNEIRDPTDSSRDVESASDLTIGEYQRLLENPERWTKLGWQAERSIFIETLDAIRKIRNEVLHFSPDPPEEHDIHNLRSFIRWLKFLDPDR